MESQFQKDLAELINKYSKENDSDTPDFILARYLNAVLDNFNAAILDREEWYGRTPHFEDIGLGTPHIEDIELGNPPDYEDTGLPPPMPPITSLDNLDTNLIH
jgi:hypothetical protein